MGRNDVVCFTFLSWSTWKQKAGDTEDETQDKVVCKKSLLAAPIEPVTVALCTGVTKK
jgi:hypothetical protein